MFYKDLPTVSSGSPFSHKNSGDSCFARMEETENGGTTVTFGGPSSLLGKKNDSRFFDSHLDITSRFLVCGRFSLFVSVGEVHGCL